MEPVDRDRRPVVIVSNDTHIGPRLVEDLRPYCPTEHLDEFDRFADATRPRTKDAATQMLAGSGYLDHPNFRTPGHHDSAARLADYDHDGIAAGVIFHGSMNMEPIPFIAQALGKPTAYGRPRARRRRHADLQPLARRLRRRRHRTATSASPTSRCGTSTRPSPRSSGPASAGLRGVNFPAMRDGALPEYNRKLWEPLWSVCEDLGMPLVTHVGGATNARYSGLEGVALLQIESGGFTSRRAVWWLIFAGVFERHPGLKLVITETPGNWFPTTADELDALWAFYDAKRDEPLNKALLDQVPRRPSEYMASNVFFGASFASPYEVEQAVAARQRHPAPLGLGLPAPRGHVRQPRGPRRAVGDPASLCATPSATSPPEDTLRMVGENAIDVYGLDADALQAVADEIGAPTLEELATPIDAVPEGASLTAFRSGAGGWG